MDNKNGKFRSGILKPALLSSARFVKLVTTSSMHLPRDRLGEMYVIHHDGRTNYSIFRETVSRDGSLETPVILVVGFRLRFLGGNPILHWLFQRICIISTPIWGGFSGFRTKLWMVDPKDKNYLGIYEWAGDGSARNYVEWLTVILRPLSTSGSVWYELYPDLKLDSYLKDHEMVVSKSASFSTI